MPGSLHLQLTFLKYENIYFNKTTVYKFRLQIFNFLLQWKQNEKKRRKSYISIIVIYISKSWSFRFMDVNKHHNVQSGLSEVMGHKFHHSNAEKRFWGIISRIFLMNLSFKHAHSQICLMLESSLLLKYFFFLLLEITWQGSFAIL